MKNLKKITALIMTTIIVIGLSNPINTSAAKKKDIGDYFTNIVHSEYEETHRNDNWTEKVRDLHFFDFGGYFRKFNKYASYYAREDKDGIMYLSYNADNGRYTVMLETDVIPPGKRLHGHSGEAISFLKIGDRKSGKVWRVKPNVIESANYVADFSKHAQARKFFYCSRDTFIQFAIVMECRLNGNFENPVHDMIYQESDLAE